MATEELIITTEKSVKNVDRLNTSINKGKKAHDKYAKSALASAKDVRIMGVSMSSLSAGFMGAVRSIKVAVLALRSFKIALAATGIGLLVLAIGALVIFLTSSQEGMDKVNKVMNKLKFTVDAIVMSFTKFGKAIFKIFTGRAIEGIQDLGDAFRDVGNQIQRNIILADEFSARQIVIEEQAITLVNQQAAYNQLIAAARTILADTDIDSKVRIKAGKEAMKAAIDLANINRFNIEEQLKNLRIGLKASNTLRADRLEIAQLEAAQTVARTQQFRMEMRLITQLRTIEKEVRTEAQKEIDKALETTAKQREIFDETAEAITTRLVPAYDKLVNALDRFAASQEGEAAKARARIRQIEKEAQEAIAAKGLQQDAWISFGQTVGSVTAQLFEQSKAARVAEIAVNTAAAIIRTLAAIPPPAGFALAAAVGAMGAVQIRKALAVELLAYGGIIKGPSHEHGGVRYSMGGRIIELEGGEAVINKRSTSIFKDQLSVMNQAGGGVKFQQGGILPRGIADAVVPSVPMIVPILVTDDLHTVENRIKVTEERATL